MRYRSTRSHDESVSFKEALFRGLARDGGLFVPENIPAFSQKQLTSIKQASVNEIGATILSLFIDDIPQPELQKIVTEGLSFPLSVRKIGKRSVLELFHGPTMAFKDVASQILPRLMEYYLKESHQHTLILTATSGDTGGAVAHGFSEKEHITVVILFPKNKVSKLQREQLTHVGENICPIEVEGTFDDCQQMVKQAFSDKDFSRYNLTSANSINIGRLLPQLIYYAYTWARLRDDNLTFVVPSGNMGNVTAGLYAKMIGIPIKKLVIACNTNDPVVRYFETGRYEKQPSHQTLSTAMDIGHPSNFERILDIANHNHDQFTKHFSAVSVNDDETIETIRDVYKTHHYLPDPHTAVAWKAADKLHLEKSVVISTASPIKFAAEIEKVAGIVVPENRKTVFTGVPKVFPSENSYERVKEIIQTFINR